MNSERQLILIGCGGHGCVVLDTAHSMGLTVHGIIDPNKLSNSLICNVPVLEQNELNIAFDPKVFQFINGIGRNPGFNRRREVYLSLKKRDFNSVTIIHPSAVLGKDTLIGEGAQIMAGTVIQCKTIIGENVVINTKSSIDHECIIHDHVFIGPGATLCGNVEIKYSAFIGAGAVILPGITIGEEAIVGAGSIVTRNVDPGTRVYGNPARRH